MNTPSCFTGSLTITLEQHSLIHSFMKPPFKPIRLLFKDIFSLLLVLLFCFAALHFTFCTEDTQKQGFKQTILFPLPTYRRKKCNGLSTKTSTWLVSNCLRNLQVVVLSCYRVLWGSKYKPWLVVPADLACVYSVVLLYICILQSLLFSMINK